MINTDVARPSFLTKEGCTSDGILNTDNRSRRSLTERLFIVAMLFYTTGAVLPFLVGGPDKADLQRIRPAELAVKAAFYAVALGFIGRQWRSVILGVWRIKWLLLLLLVALASTLWSQYPSLTLRGSAVLLATTAFGVYFGTRYTVSEQLRLLAWMCFLMIAASYFFAIFLPGYGVEQSVNFGDWKGAFIQKNNLAEATVFSVLVFLFVPSMSRSLRCLGLISSSVLLFFSRSATGMIVAFVIVITLPLYRLVRARSTAAVLVFLGLLLAGLLLVSTTSTAELFRLVNRSPDLTGRTELWDAVLLSVAKRPWLGYGFSAFWQGMDGESGYVMDAVGWMPGFAHNGYLDVVLQLGVLGLTIFAVGYFVLWRRALALLSIATGAIPIWLCTFLVFMLLYNLTEGCILVQNDLYWVLYISTAVSLSAACSRDGCIRQKGYFR